MISNKMCRLRLSLLRLSFLKAGKTTRTQAIRSLASVAPTTFGGDNPSSSNTHHWMAAAAAATALAGSLLYENYNEKTTTKCCGIAGVVGTGSYDARSFLLDGLTILKNRGFDSAGLVTMKAGGGPMAVTKFASEGDTSNSIDLVKKHSVNVSAGHSVGIAHTRWATHGAKTDENAHPHMDTSGKIALVHNGTLNNANALRRELQGLGHFFTSQTDSEVIAKLIGHYYTKKPDSVKEATEKALARCDGTWGLCVMCSDEPEQLVVACNGSPMVLGIGDDRTYVASETEAFANHTKTFISMNDGEIAVLHADGNTLDLSRTEEAEIDDDDLKMTPEPYPHWTLKELNEQPEAAARALAFGGRMGYDKVHLGGLDDNYDRLSKIKHLLIAACGTSLHAARYGELLMKHLGALDSVHTMDASETEDKDFPCPEQLDQTGLLVVSQSGETKDVVNVVNSAMDGGVSVMSVVNSVGSSIARMTKLGVYCNAGKENAVASTKAFTNQVAVLALIALWFRQNHPGAEPPEATRVKEALMRLPLSFGSALKTHAKCKEIAAQLQNKEHCFVLGKGFGEPVAMEGALKIKEFSYMHAEGYSGGALKHGPFALIEGPEGKFGATPVIMLILDDHHAHHMRTAAEEVKARGAHVIIITDKIELADGLDENPIVIPSNGPLTALGAVLPMQLLAYELAMQRGINPDTPRNLAKAVLVD